MSDIDYLGSVTPISDHAHFFVWAGDPNYPIPEGYPCSCGMTVAHYETCPCCGQKVLKAIPIDQGLI